jgi:hypothetical protein
MVLSALALLVGFGFVVRYERQHARRFFASPRARLDAHIERIEFILEHVDLGAFVRDEIRHMMNRVGHTVAHLSLQVVRMVERLLTRLVRYLRMTHENTAEPRESTREFVKTLSDFKDTLQATHPDIDESAVE